MLDKNSPIPLYYQLKEELKRQIEAGDIMPGDKLLSESEMMDRYGIGRLTVREALSQLVNEGYLEKQHGKGTFLKSRKNPAPPLNIDVLLNTSDNYFIPYYIRGIHEVLTAHNANFLIHDTRNDMEEIAVLLEKILQKETSGVILQPGMREEKPSQRLIQLFGELRARKIPFIMIDSRYKDIDSAYVVLDEVRGGRIAAEHLVTLGHKSIAGVFYSGIHDSIQRQTGAMSYLKRQGRQVKARWHWMGENVSFDALHAWITGDEKVTGVICYNDEIALRCLNYLRDRGLKIPGDVSVIGYDDSFIAESAVVPLTTIAHPKEEMARMAAEKLIGMIQGSVKRPFVHTFEPRLVVRESSGKRS